MPSFVVLRSPCRIVVVVLLAWSLLPSLDLLPARGQPAHPPTLVDTVTVDPQIDEQYDTYVGETSRHWTFIADLHLVGQREMGDVGAAFGFAVGGGYTWRRIGADLTLNYTVPEVRASFWEESPEPDDLGGHTVLSLNLRTSLRLFRTSSTSLRALGGVSVAGVSPYRTGCGLLGRALSSDERIAEECDPLPEMPLGVDSFHTSYGIDLRFYDPLKYSGGSFFGFQIMRTGAEYQRNGAPITGGPITVSIIIGAWGSSDR